MGSNRSGNWDRGHYEWVAITSGGHAASGNWDGPVTNGWWEGYRQDVDGILNNF